MPIDFSRSCYDRSLLSVPFHPNIRRNGVSEHAFDLALAGCDFSYLDRSGGGHVLVGHCFEKFADPYSTGVSSSAACGEYMVGSDGLVSIGNCGFLADKK